MKRSIVITIISLLFFSATAQKLGIVTGFNLANVKDKAAWGTGLSRELDTKTKLGLRTGLLAEYEHKTGITAGIQVLYSQLGYKLDTASQSNTTIKVSYSYLELPVYIGYIYTINEELKVFYDYFPLKAFVNFGPNFGIALSGKSKFGTLEPIDIDFGDTAPQLNPH